MLVHASDGCIDVAMEFITSSPVLCDLSTHFDTIELNESIQVIKYALDMYEYEYGTKDAFSFRSFTSTLTLQDTLHIFLFWKKYMIKEHVIVLHTLCYKLIQVPYNRFQSEWETHCFDFVEEWIVELIQTQILSVFHILVISNVCTQYSNLRTTLLDHFDVKYRLRRALLRKTQSNHNTERFINMLNGHIMFTGSFVLQSIIYGVNWGNTDIDIVYLAYGPSQGINTEWVAQSQNTNLNIPFSFEQTKTSTSYIYNTKSNSILTWNGESNPRRSVSLAKPGYSWISRSRKYTEAGSVEDVTLDVIAYSCSDRSKTSFEFIHETFDFDFCKIAIYRDDNDKLFRIWIHDEESIVKMHSANIQRPNPKSIANRIDKYEARGFTFDKDAVNLLDCLDYYL